MPISIFRTGTKSRSNSLPGRRTGKGSGYFSAQIDPASRRAVARTLRDLEPKLKNNIAKRALRDWGKAVRKSARANAWKWADRTKKQMMYKVKQYKHAVWGGVGVKTERVGRSKRAERLGRFSAYVGWKAHFMEVGWHAWPRKLSGNRERARLVLRNKLVAAGKGGTRMIVAYRNGKPHTRVIREKAITLSRDGEAGGGGRGWKRGLRGHKGAFQSQYARHYLFKAHVYGKQIAPKLIVDSINRAVRELKGVAA